MALGPAVRLGLSAGPAAVMMCVGDRHAQTETGIVNHMIDLFGIGGRIRRDLGEI